MWFDPKSLLMAGQTGAVFVALEFLFPARPAPAFRWRRYATDLLHLSVGNQLNRIGTAILIVLLLDGAGPGGPAADLPFWVQFILLLLMGDLVIWLLHRLSHAVPWLWEFHKVHHSSEQLDWLAAYRFHPVDQIIPTTAVLIAPTLLGFSPAVVATYMLLYSWHSHLLHSNLEVKLGPLEWVFNTPRFHHWHHAGHVEAYDRNFGAQLVIWDRMFGTVYKAPQARPDCYGVDDPPRESFLAHLVTPFRPSRRNDEVGPASTEPAGS